MRIWTEDRRQRRTVIIVASIAMAVFIAIGTIIYQIVTSVTLSDPEYLTNSITVDETDDFVVRKLEQHDGTLYIAITKSWFGSGISTYFVRNEGDQNAGSGQE